MEARIKSRFNDSVLAQILAAYDIHQADVQLLDGFESFIYEFQRGPRNYILRIGHSSRRPENLIRGEVDWINYLHQGGAGVSRAILASTGELVVPVDDGQGELFLATAFEKAAGGPPAAENLGPGFYQTYGRLIGRMHALSQNYKPGFPGWVRPAWDDPIMLEVLAWLPESEALVAARYLALKEYLDQLPKSSSTYGLIHFDAHMGNMFIDEQGNLTLFDFDDCNYSWFINDIAILLFYITFGRDNQTAFTRNFMQHFLSGYRSECQLEAGWLKQIPFFLKLREMDLYAVIHRSFDVQAIDHPWVAKFMEGRKQRIENEIPVIDFDFEEFED
jgi:Ser/Thr protein kinase RdoA (MazF antagonist)